MTETPPFVITFPVMNALPKLLKLTLLPLLAVSLQAANTYKVQSGDTLSSIARKNGTTTSKLMKTNGISNPNKLRVGQVLKISNAAAPAPTQATSSTKPRSSTSGNYTVKSGETLYSIARKHGLSVSQLTNMNPGLDPGKLSVGQKISTNGSTKPKAKPVAKPQPVPVIAELPKTNSTPTPVATPIPEPLGVPTSSSLPSISSISTKKVEAPAAISSIVVNKEISFGALASKHRTSTKQLNELNGWNLRPTTILARESEVYVPGT